MAAAPRIMEGNRRLYRRDIQGGARDHDYGEGLVSRGLPQWKETIHEIKLRRQPSETQFLS
jgi:hypothetical protein